MARNGYQQLFDLVDKVYIINVLQREDRRRRITKMLLDMGLENELFSHKIEFITSIPLPYLTENVLEYMDKNGTGHFYNALTNKYSLGVAMCCTEHYRVLKMADFYGYKKILILEDDATFLKDDTIIENAIKTIPQEFNILHLEGFYWPTDNKDEEDKKNILKQYANLDQWIPSHTFPLWASAGLLYSRGGIKSILEDMENNGFKTFDCHTIWSTDKSYCYYLPIIKQVDDFSNTTDACCNGRETFNVYLSPIDKDGFLKEE